MDAPGSGSTAGDDRLEAVLAPFAGARLRVGFSGGLDSTVLLHALAARRARLAGLRAIHVDHGLQADAAAWAAHCQDACERLGLPCVLARASVRPDGRGVEAAARAARFAAFEAALRPGELLVLAQHRDDQAETVLLRLLRGAGSDGLAAMHAQRDHGALRVHRPLRVIPRAHQQALAQRQGLRWLEDPSNATQAFDRNHLRHAILPALRERWPQADAALATSARLLGEDAALLADEAGRRLAAVRLDDGGLSVPGLLALSAPWRSRVLRQWLAAAAVPAPPAAAHARIDAELLAARHDATPILHWPGGGLRRWRAGLYLAPGPGAPAPGVAAWRLDWDGRGWLALPDGGQLGFEPGGVQHPGAKADSLPALGPLQVASRRGGERLRLPGRTHRHALKDLLQAAAVPPWERARLPLLFAGDGELLAAGDRWIGARLEAWSAARGCRLRWRADAD
jgi:tRNA(Ile)-lysidine synthase